jgi:hypothetical protein
MICFTSTRVGTHKFVSTLIDYWFVVRRRRARCYGNAKCNTGRRPASRERRRPTHTHDCCCAATWRWSTRQATLKWNRGKVHSNTYMLFFSPSNEGTFFYVQITEHFYYLYFFARKSTVQVQATISNAQCAISSDRLKRPKLFFLNYLHDREWLTS